MMTHTAAQGKEPFFFKEDKIKVHFIFFCHLSVFEIILNYPEDQFVNNLLLRYLGCFYHQRQKAGKVSHPGE